MIISIIPMSLFTVSAEDSATSGTCGENLTWSLNDETGVLTISGTGVMYDYNWNNRPWEEYRNKIEKVVIDNGVTTIGKNAFFGCYYITSVTIPNTVTAIEERAFQRCESIVNISIPNSVTTIGYCAFNECYGLTNIIIPGNVPMIGEWAFSWCTNLTSVIIHENVTTIGENAFYYCYKLANVTLPNSITRIGDSAFELCYNLEYVNYNGSEEDWKQVSIGKNNMDLRNATIHFNYCEHIFCDWFTVVAPTCTEIGSEKRICSKCKKDEIRDVSILSHKYNSVIIYPTCTSQGYTTYTCHCGDTYTGDYVDVLAHNYKDGICTDCETPDPSYFTFEIQQPSRTTIRCNDGIKLHTKITGKLPDGSRIEWTKNNNNFNMTTSASGNEITIISKNNGYTTFTATVYDADNNVIAEDTVEMYSKAGLFDKIGGFFRSLFGTTKIYDN